MSTLHTTPSSCPTKTQHITVAASKMCMPVFSVKLDYTNYLQRKQQVEGVLCGTKMVKPYIFLQFFLTTHREAGSENPAYTEWEEQDLFHFTWILSMIFSSLLL